MYGEPPSRIAASHNGIAMAAVNLRGQLYARVDNPLQKPPPDFYPQYDAGGHPMQASRVAIDADPTTGEVQLIAIGGDRRLWHRTLPQSGDWSAWGSPPPDFFQATDVAMSIDGTGTAHVAAIGLDQHVNYRVRRADRTWSGWTIVSDDGPDPRPERAGAVAISASRQGAVDLYLATSQPDPGGRYAIGRYSKPADGDWTGRQRIAERADPFPNLAAGQGTLRVDGAPKSVSLVVATSAGPVTRVLIVDQQQIGPAVGKLPSGWSSLAVCAAPDGEGIGYLTWQ
jgi:hypothetical protein